MSAAHGQGGVHPGLDEPLVIDVAWDSTEQPVEFSVCGHRLNQDQRQRIQVGRVDLGVRPCNEPADQGVDRTGGGDPDRETTNSLRREALRPRA